MSSRWNKRRGNNNNINFSHLERPSYWRHPFFLSFYLQLPSWTASLKHQERTVESKDSHSKDEILTWHFIFEHELCTKHESSFAVVTLVPLNIRCHLRAIKIVLTGTFFSHSTSFEKYREFSLDHETELFVISVWEDGEQSYHIKSEDSESCLSKRIRFPRYGWLIEIQWPSRPWLRFPVFQVIHLKAWNDSRRRWYSQNLDKYRQMASLLYLTPFHVDLWLWWVWYLHYLVGGLVKIRPSSNQNVLHPKSRKYCINRRWTKNATFTLKPTLVGIGIGTCRGGGGWRRIRLFGRFGWAEGGWKSSAPNKWFGLGLFVPHAKWEMDSTQDSLWWKNAIHHHILVTCTC